MSWPPKTRTLDPNFAFDQAKIARFELSLTLRKEVGHTEWGRAVDKLPDFVIGSSRGVRLPLGPNILWSEHTHPLGDPAMPSKGDIRSAFLGEYDFATTHAIVGSKWPNTNAVLDLYGLKLDPTVVVTTFKNRDLQNPMNVTNLLKTIQAHTFLFPD